MRALSGSKTGRRVVRRAADRLNGLRGRRAGEEPDSTVILTTTGAKTGLPGTVSLEAIPHRDGIAVVAFVAENEGDGCHPTWYQDLLAVPAAVVTLGGETWLVTARVATPVEREEIWARGAVLHPRLAKEREQGGDRRMTAFILERA